MKDGICLSLILGLLCLIPGKSFALEVAPVSAYGDSVKSTSLYFQFNQDEVLSDYLDNAKTILLLDSLFLNAPAFVQPDSVMITSLVLPEGSPKFNIWLAEHRAGNVKEFLSNRYPSLKTKFVLCRKEMDWTDFRDLIANDTSVPNRDDVLRLIDFHHDEPGKCKRLLQYLNGNEPYQYITKHILPRLHQSEILISWNYPDLFAPLAEMKPVLLSAASVQNEIISFSKTLNPSTPSETSAVTPKTVLALKNNLLYDLVLAPNLEMEIPVGDHWSLNAEFKCPWWLNDKHNFCYQLLSGGAEGRLWLGKRQGHNRLIGHFLGLYAEGGKYDFQFDSTEGVQGNYYAAGGLSYGYTKRLARHLSFEFSFGVGCLYSKYRTYTSSGNKLIWKDTRDCIYVGPTKVKISIVWLIGTK